MKAKLNQNPFAYHKEKIALSTLKLSDVGAMIMGGPNKAESRAYLLSVGYTQAEIDRMEK